MIPFPDKHYSIIYADPPWNFKAYSHKGDGRSASQHYEIMSLEDLQTLPIGKIAEKDCALFIWVTAPLLLQGIATLQAWGFTYKTVAFTWVKTTRKVHGLFWGMGYWTRSNAEYCLLGTLGKPHRVSRAVHSVLIEDVRDHSRKPDTIRGRIVDLMGDQSRIELFARTRFPGWDSWGYEVL